MPVRVSEKVEPRIRRIAAAPRRSGKPRAATTASRIYSDLRTELVSLHRRPGEAISEAQIALSYVRAHAEEFGISPEQLDHPIHLHVPAGAVPKDGPSAGVTMTTALVSLLLGRTVRAEVGMTGEVSLTGRVLPIGGVKQKLLAAQRAGLTEVYVPKRNEPDLDEVPADVLEALTVHIVSDVRDILRTALDQVSVSAVAAA